MDGLALEQFAATDLADEFAVADGYLAADGDNGGASFNGHAFEGVVIHVGSLGLGRQRSPIIWIVNDQVRVTPQLDRAFSWEQAEQLC